MRLRFSLRSWLVGLLYLAGALGVIAALSPGFRLETKVQDLTMTETLQVRLGGPWDPVWSYDRVHLRPTPITSDFVVPPHLEPFKGPPRTTVSNAFSFTALLISLTTLALSSVLIRLAGHLKGLPAVGGELDVQIRGD